MTIQSYAAEEVLAAEVLVVVVEVFESEPAEAMAAWAMSPIALTALEFSLKRTFLPSSCPIAAAVAPLLSPI